MEVYHLLLVIFLVKSQVFGVEVDPPFSLQLKWGNDNTNKYLCNQNADEQITWVDYYGKIPPNAIIAGTREDGSNVYIGQVYHVRDGRGIGIAPVAIAKGDLEVQVADNRQIYPQKLMIKILTGVSDAFEWIDTDSDTAIINITNNTLVRGGHQHYFGQIYEYIGRTKKNGETFVGRAMQDTTDSKVAGLQLIYNKNGAYTIDKSEFQVLSVKPNVFLCTKPENQLNVILN